MRLARRTVTYGGVDVVVLAFVGFLVRMPTGELRFGVAMSDMDGQTGTGGAGDAKATYDRMLDGVQAQISAAEDLYRDLSFAQTFPLPEEFHPPKAKYGGGNGAAFIEEFRIGQSAGAFDIRANGLALYDWLYDRLGIRDHYLALTSLEPEPCASSDCWRVTVNYTFGEGGDAELSGTVDQIERDLGAFVVAVSVQEARRSWLRQGTAKETAPDFLHVLPDPPSYEAWKAALVPVAWAGEFIDKGGFEATMATPDMTSFSTPYFLIMGEQVGNDYGDWVYDSLREQCRFEAEAFAGTNLQSLSDLAARTAGSGVDNLADMDATVEVWRTAVSDLVEERRSIGDVGAKLLENLNE